MARAAGRQRDREAHPDAGARRCGANGDGKNDVFRMVTKGNQQISVFQVMDRWGKRVFETVNQHEGWDGSYNSEPQDLGTYQYYLRYKCADSGETVEMKGDVILVR